VDKLDDVAFVRFSFENRVKVFVTVFAKVSPEGFAVPVVFPCLALPGDGLTSE
jgi:hypothetical protein